MIWLLLAGALAFLFWYHCVRPLNHFTRMGVKQVSPVPIFGDNWKSILMLESFAEVVGRIYKSHPDSRYVGGYQFMRPTLMLRDPDLIKQITVKDFEHFTDHDPITEPSVDPLWSRILFFLQGHRWKEMRATLSGSFTGSKMKLMFGIINEVAEDFVNYFLNKDQDLIEVELKGTYTKFTNDVVASAAFGIKVDSLAQPDNIFFTMVKKLLATFNEPVVKLKTLLVFQAPKLVRLFNVSIFAKEVSHYFRNIIHETIKVREEKGIVRQDMIHLLLEARKGITNEEENVTDTGFATVKESNSLDNYKLKRVKQLSNDDITSQALQFFLAGFDTMSTALCFGSYEMALNKEVQDKLRQEIIETHKAVDGKLTYDALLNMKYMDMVFSEMLRIWSPVVTVDRVCTKPYTIPPKHPDEKPVHLKVGDLLWIPIFGLHRNPKYYSEPEKFIPERFSDENKQYINPYAYLPFGAGPRNCIGSRFAILEAKILLYHLLLNFEIVRTKHTKIPLKLSAKSVRHTAEGGYHVGFQRIK